MPEASTTAGIVRDLQRQLIKSMGIPKRIMDEATTNYSSHSQVQEELNRRKLEERLRQCY